MVIFHDISLLFNRGEQSFDISMSPKLEQTQSPSFHVDSAAPEARRFESDKNDAIDAFVPPSTAGRPEKMETDEASTKQAQKVDQDVAWLRSELDKRQGHSQFSEQRNHKLSNPDRVVFWMFAAKFSVDYHKRISPLTVRVSIYRALVN